MYPKTIRTRSRNEASPVERFDPVIPDDNANLPLGVCRALFVSGAGTMTVVDRYGTAVQLVSSAGQYHPVQVMRVCSTNTSATGIIALY